MEPTGQRLKVNRAQRGHVHDPHGSEFLGGKAGVWETLWGWEWGADRRAWHHQFGKGKLVYVT